MFQRIFKIGLVAALCAAAAFLAYHFRIWERDWSHIDDGWASLIGSFMGAFLAVVGALYVSKAEDRRKKKEFEDFVCIAVQNIVIQASYLEAMAREPHKLAADPHAQYGIVSIQMRTLTDALAVFDREIAHSKDGDYQLRRSIIQLDAMLAESRHQLTMNIDPRSLEVWHTAAYQVRWHASSFLEGQNWIVPKPNPEKVGLTMKASIETWTNWNIPVYATTVPSFDAHFRQPLNIPQRAHA
jgi:hypothetical protein